MKLTIKNMVCDRCRTAVEHILHGQGLPVLHIDLGEVELTLDPSAKKLDLLRTALEKQGFELVDEREAVMIARIKAAIVKLVHHDDAARGRVKLSEHLASALNRNYSALSTLFSQVEGISIEHYFLLQRMERVKEMIRYGEHSLSEIADSTGFSSVAHLSGQFKKLTGMTPSAFKTLSGGRTPLDEVGG
jgi:AraC-like DNA-binding protein